MNCCIRGHVEAILRLEEVCARLNLLGHALRSPVEGRHKRVDGCAQEEAWLGRDLAPAEKDALVADDARRAQELDGVEVEDALGLRLVAGADVVAREAEHVVHAQRGCAQDVALDGDAVAVAAADLQDGFIAGAGQQRAAAQTAHVAVGAGTVGGVDGVAYLREHQRVAVDVFGVGAVGRVELGGDGEAAGAQDTFEAACRARRARLRLGELVRRAGGLGGVGFGHDGQLRPSVVGYRRHFVSPALRMAVT